MDTASFHVYLGTGSEALQLQKSCGTVVGELNPHYSKILRVLQNAESIELQTLVVPSPLPHASPRQTTNRGRKAGQVKVTSPTLSVILYGPMDLFESIGDFLSQCSEYLQPPLRCDRNVLYYNPQSLGGRKGDPQMTFQLQGELSLSGVETMTQGVDPSAALETEDLNPEMEAPAAVKSSLYRYTPSQKTLTSFWQCQIPWLIANSHQKRALSFMLMKERSMRQFNKQQGRWTACFDESDGTTE